MRHNNEQKQDTFFMITFHWIKTTQQQKQKENPQTQSPTQQQINLKKFFV